MVSQVTDVGQYLSKETFKSNLPFFSSYANTLSEEQMFACGKIY